MVFSSIIFLFFFLPLTLGLYYIMVRKYRNMALLFSSLIFYLWGGGWFLGVLIVSTLIDYTFGLILGRAEGWKRHLWLSCSVLLNISLLAYFKYANFFVSEFNRGASHLGIESIRWSTVILPIGISFFTFHKISYIVDIYRGTCKALRSLVDFALYIILFPQLIAGPIVRFHEISEQLKNRTETLEGFYHGVLRLSLGLVKKVMLANNCGEIADAIFALNISSLDTKTAWIGIFAYTLQIYFDFSGYSDMAIGLGLMFGFKLPENFNRPYSAVSITDFWRRWHISLSNFLRDYLYIPLGGSRCNTAQTYLNLMIIFVVCGLWHGANWTFVVWGGYHGFLLMIERITGLRQLEESAHVFLRRMVTFLLVMVGWVFFRSADFKQAAGYLSAMFFPMDNPLPLQIIVILNTRNIVFLLIAASVVFFKRDFAAINLLIVEKKPVMTVVTLSVLLILVLYSVTCIASGSYNPFLYFQF